MYVPPAGRFFGKKLRKKLMDESFGPIFAIIPFHIQDDANEGSA